MSHTALQSVPDDVRRTAVAIVGAIVTVAAVLAATAPANAAPSAVLVDSSASPSTLAGVGRIVGEVANSGDVPTTITVEATLYSAAGAVLGTSRSVAMTDADPNERVPFVNVFGVPTGYDHYAITRTDAAASERPNHRLTVLEVRAERDGSGSLHFRGQVRNDNDVDAQLVRVILILRRASGFVMDVTSTYISSDSDASLAARATANFDMTYWGVEPERISAIGTSTVPPTTTTTGPSAAQATTTTTTAPPSPPPPTACTTTTTTAGATTTSSPPCGPTTSTTYQRDPCSPVTTIPGESTTSYTTSCPSTTTTTQAAGGTSTTVPGTTTSTAPPGQRSVTRVAGADRIETAIAVSRNTFGRSSAAVLARADDFPDALAGSTLAASRNGPLLLTNRQRLDLRTALELNRLAPRNATYLLGGAAALSTTVEDDVRSVGATPMRIAGEDRYATAAAIAGGPLHSPSAVLLASGLDFPDAVIAANVAPLWSAAVLLTAGRQMPPATATYLGSHPPSSKWAIGAPASAADPQASPVFGEDRYATSRRAATEFFGHPARVAVATGSGFADALAGSAVSNRFGPLLLTYRDRLPETIREYLAQEQSIRSAVIYGGPDAVSDGVAAELVLTPT